MIRAPARCVLAALVLFAAARASAESVHVAVATNFAATCRHVGDAFRAATGHELVITAGSSGKLAAQIANGAPFDLFLSADAARPAQLEAAQHAVAGTRFTYALGRLALWSARPDFVTGEATLQGGAFRHLAIANPELAPYGAAARDVLLQLGLWDRLAPKLVRGENVGQAFHFVATGNAELGFVALAQVAAREGGSQLAGAVVAPRADRAAGGAAAAGADDPAARDFLAFLRSDAARAIIERPATGYLRRRER